ncbi:MAG: VanZ family protein [bacterium]
MFFLIPVIGISLAIVLLSNQATFDLPVWNIIGFDKVAHLGAFFAYGLCVQFAYSGMSNIPLKKKIILYTILISALFGASDEIHQYFVPGRTCDIFDFIADVTGASLSLLLMSTNNKIVNYIKLRLK